MEDEDEYKDGLPSFVNVGTYKFYLKLTKTDISKEATPVSSKDTVSASNDASADKVGQTQEVNNIESCIFGAKLLQNGQTMDANYKVRMYYSVNNPDIKAPQRGDDLTIPTYYVVDYDFPFTFVPTTPTAVEKVTNTKQIMSVTYVSTTGVSSSKPFSGLNIVVTRFDDGTCASAKKVF